MKTVNFNQPIVNLDGVPMKKEQDKPLMMKEIVANTMCVAKARKADEVVRQLNTAMEIYKSDKEIVLEDADFKLVKDLLSTADLSALVLGQIMKVLEAAEK